MQKKAKLIWCLFIICLIAMIGLRIAMEVQELEYEEVEVRVVSAETKHVKNRKTGSTQDYYIVKVAYKGEVHELGNAYKTSQYDTGDYVKAYVSNGHLFANIEGVSTSTPVAKVYFACLYGCFGLLIAGVYFSAKEKEEAKEN